MVNTEDLGIFKGFWQFVLQLFGSTKWCSKWLFNHQTVVLTVFSNQTFWLQVLSNRSEETWGNWHVENAVTLQAVLGVQFVVQVQHSSITVCISDVLLDVVEVRNEFFSICLIFNEVSNWFANHFVELFSRQLLTGRTDNGKVLLQEPLLKQVVRWWVQLTLSQVSSSTEECQQCCNFCRHDECSFTLKKSK